MTAAAQALAAVDRRYGWLRHSVLMATRSVKFRVSRDQILAVHHEAVVSDLEGKSARYWISVISSFMRIV